MASLKESISKGLTTINVKTSNFMEESKYKTQITSLEKDINDLKTNLGGVYYSSKISGENVDAQLDNLVEQIKTKYELIEEQKKLIEDLAKNEQQILGTGATDIIYCTKCGAQNNKGNKFCTGCGQPL